MKREHFSSYVRCAFVPDFSLMDGAPKARLSPPPCQLIPHESRYCYAATVLSPLQIQLIENAVKSEFSGRALPLRSCLPQSLRILD